MTKKAFEEWAIEKYSYEFSMYRGELKWFGFSFWELELDITKELIKEFKDDRKQSTQY